MENTDNSHEDNNMIPIDNQLKEFDRYLEANSRCILSAKFGDGKSYFLSNFMKQYEEKYLFIPIFPINYQIVENKDIIELIKRDILLRLLSSPEIKIDNVDISNALLIWNLLSNNKIDAALELTNLLPNIIFFGLEIKLENIGSKLKTLTEKIKTYNQRFHSDDKKVENYFTGISAKSGSIYEFDFYSQLINDIIDNNKTTKKIVLIIEDLDRIDPAHLFRILNVFSSHFDRYGENAINGRVNKYGFDKVITVCDYDNIKSIYAHIYGVETDFTGYISKFFSSKEYRYSIIDSYKEYLYQLLDDDLKTSHNLCREIIELFVNKLVTGKHEFNLRLIINKIKSIDTLIRTKKISINEEGMFVNSDSKFSRLLSLMNIFDVRVEFKNNRLIKSELLYIVDKYWTLAAMFDKRLHFRKSDNKIEGCLNTDAHTYRSIFCTLGTCSNNEVISVNISNMDEKIDVISAITVQYNKIEEFLRKEILL